MNNKLVVEAREFIKEIVGLAYDISSNEDNAIEVHIDYMGHVNGINISVYAEGVLNKKDSYINETFYFEDYWLGNTKGQLPKVIEKLTKIKETGAINLEEFTPRRTNIYNFTGGI